MQRNCLALTLFKIAVHRTDLKQMKAMLQQPKQKKNAMHAAIDVTSIALLAGLEISGKLL